MDAFIEYITNPWTIVSFIVFVFWLGATWSNLNWGIKSLEKRVDKIEELDLAWTLKEIQTNLKWIMEKLNEK